MRQLMSLWAVFVLGLINKCLADGFEHFNRTELGFSNCNMVPITLIQGADAEGAVCLDGTLPAYHLDRGWGSQANNWLVNLEIVFYAKRLDEGHHYMAKEIEFRGILSNRVEENPDFYNWNRVKIRYCDGGSFSGDNKDKAAKLQYRGQRIYLAAIDELMSKGMRNAKQALLAGCSAGGLAAILHCDEFGKSFPSSTKVKCFADAGLFLDAVDVATHHTLRHYFGGVIRTHRIRKYLPSTCRNHLDATSCFFPENFIRDIKTPLFLLNAAYDTWQVHQSLMPHSADPKGTWVDCRNNYAKCEDWQIKFLQDFRNHMLNVVKEFSLSKQNGLFINSCFIHCQSERQDTWLSDKSPVISNKEIAKSVGDWYFDRTEIKAIDCPYPCDKTCHNEVFKNNANGYFISNF